MGPQPPRQPRLPLRPASVCPPTEPQCVAGALDRARPPPIHCPQWMLSQPQASRHSWARTWVDIPTAWPGRGLSEQSCVLGAVCSALFH